MDWTHRLRLRHLQVLLSLAGTGNLSQSVVAATTQPALSKWLKELEEDVGCRCSSGMRAGLRPTPYGEALIEHARRVEAQLDIARDDMAALREGGSGLVTIGTSVAAADTVPLAVSQLLKRMPRAQVRMTESTMNQLMPQLARSELDIVGARDRHPSIRCCAEALYVDPVVFVARPGHALAGATSVGWDDVLAYSWIVWPSARPCTTRWRPRCRPPAACGPHCVESNSSILNLTLLNNTDLLGVASHRAAQLRA